MHLLPVCDRLPWRSQLEMALIVSWHVGDRSAHTGVSFMGDLRARLTNRVQLTTDGHKAYLRAVAEVDFDADYAMLVKIFANDYAGAGRYSPPKCIGAVKQAIMGNPDPDLSIRPLPSART